MPTHIWNPTIQAKNSLKILLHYNFNGYQLSCLAASVSSAGIQLGSGLRSLSVTVCLQALLPSSRAVTWHRKINPTLWAQRGSKKVLGVSPACLLTPQPPQWETQAYSSHTASLVFIPNPGRHHLCRKLKHDVHQQHMRHHPELK